MTISEKQVQENNSIIDEIAQKLSLNYLYASLNDQERKFKVQSGFSKKIFSSHFLRKTDLNTPAPSRNVLVLGAGATYDSFKHIPLANDAIKIFKNQYYFDEKIRNDEHLSLQLHNIVSKILNSSDSLEVLLKGLDFENSLTVLSNYYSERTIKGFIQKIFNVRYQPSIKYELIAHLFKNRFMDVIINFNFDELLDQCIEDELGVGNYTSIISDGDCKPLNDLMTDGRLKVPIYIKPHGTASHTSSLRFTKDSYIDLPQGINNLMANILQGKTSDNESTPIPNVNIFTVGFGMKSIEFSKMLREILNSENGYKTNLKIYHVNVEKHYTSKYVKNIKPGENDIVNSPKYNRYFLIKNSNAPNADSFFEKLWNRIEDNFQEPYKPRHIARHKIIYGLFYNEMYRRSLLEEQENYFGGAEYFYDRLIVEVAIALAKSKGNLELSKVINERIGLYYNLYKQAKKVRSQEAESLHNVCTKKFGLREVISYGRSTYSIPVNQATHKNITDYLLDCLSQNKSVTNFLKVKVNHIKEQVRFELQRIYDSFTADIKPKYRDRIFYIFDSFQKENILHTNLALTYNFYTIASDLSKWDIACVVSERGGVVKNIFRYNEGLGKELSQRKDSIFLITSDLSQSDEVDYPRDILVTGKPFLLPYFQHNHHMVIFLKKEQTVNNLAKTRCGSYQFVKTIYFYKNSLDNEINPIVFGSEKKYEPDHRALMEIFSSYYVKSKNYMDDRKITYIPNAIFLGNQEISVLGRINAGK